MVTVLGYVVSSFQRRIAPALTLAMILALAGAIPAAAPPPNTA